MEEGIVAPVKKSKRKKVKKEKEEIPEESETVSEEKQEDLISFEDKDSLFTVFKEVWFDIQPMLSTEMLEKRNVEKSINVFNKILFDRVNPVKKLLIKIGSIPFKKKSNDKVQQRQPLLTAPEHSK